MTLTKPASPPRLRDAIGEAEQLLSAAGSESARLDAELLLGHALGLTREQLMVRAEAPLGAEPAQRFRSFLARRLQREPVAYIIGRQEFWSLEFHVNRAVLIPRPETERLIEVALRLAAQAGLDRPLRVLDMGTGSGAIAVSLAKELPWARIDATDIVPSALAVARRNAILHKVSDRITFRCGDLFAAVADQQAGFDLLVANPPYIRRPQIAALKAEVRQWEPRTALDGGVDGLDFYRRIAAQAAQFLAKDGAIAMEIDADRGSDVLPLFMQSGLTRDVMVFQDYAGRERVAVARVAADRAS